MPDFVEVDGKLIQLPKDTEADPAAKAAFLKKQAKTPKGEE